MQYIVRGTPKTRIALTPGGVKRQGRNSKVIRNMNDKQFSLLWHKAISTESRDDFVSGCVVTSAAGDPESGAPEDRDRILGELWDVAHMSVREIRDVSGLTQQAFSDRFCIPRRTLEDWEGARRSCPDYLRLLLAQAVGAYKRI